MFQTTYFLFSKERTSYILIANWLKHFIVFRTWGVKWWKGCGSDTWKLKLTHLVWAHTFPVPTASVVLWTPLTAPARRQWGGWDRSGSTGPTLSPLISSGPRSAWRNRFLLHKWYNQHFSSSCRIKRAKKHIYVTPYVKTWKILKVGWFTGM